MTAPASRSPATTSVCVRMIARSRSVDPGVIGSIYRSRSSRDLDEHGLLPSINLRSSLTVLCRQPVEMLRGAAHLTLAHQFDQVRFRQLGDVIVRVAEGDLQLAAEVAGREDAAAV